MTCCASVIICFWYFIQVYNYILCFHHILAIVPMTEAYFWNPSVLTNLKITIKSSSLEAAVTWLKYCRSIRRKTLSNQSIITWKETKGGFPSFTMFTVVDFQPQRGRALNGVNPLREPLGLFTGKLLKYLFQMVHFILSSILVLSCLYHF